WLTATPFGTPVLPDVNRRYAGLSGLTSGVFKLAYVDSSPVADKNVCRGNCRSYFSRESDRSKMTRSDFPSAERISPAIFSHSSPMTSVSAPERRSIVRFLCDGNFGFSGTYAFLANNDPRTPP